MKFRKTNNHFQRILFMLLFWNVFWQPLVAGAATAVSYEVRPLSQILVELSEEFQVFFSYDSKSVASVNMDFSLMSGESFENAIERVLIPIGFGYESYGDKYFLVYKKDKKGQRETEKLRKHLKKIQKLETGGSFMLQYKSKDPLIQLQRVARSLQPQLIPVTGTVTDGAGEPLVGVNILIKGTSQGTITDLEGKFSLDISSGQEVLIFSYTGYDA